MATSPPALHGCAAARRAHFAAKESTQGGHLCTRVSPHHAIGLVVCHTAAHQSCMRRPGPDLTSQGCRHTAPRPWGGSERRDKHPLAVASARRGVDGQSGQEVYANAPHNGDKRTQTGPSRESGGSRREGAARARTCVHRRAALQTARENMSSFLSSLVVGGSATEALNI